jgi:hypothetical protein
VKRKPIAAGVVASILLSMLAAAQSGPASSRDLLVIVKNGRYGFIDHAGKVVIRPRFLWGDDFEDGIGNVFVCSRDVWIDESGKAMPQRPPDRYLLHDGRRAHRVGGKVGFVDATGEFKIKPTYDDALPFSDGAAAVEREGKWGFIDTSGHEVIQPVYEGAFYFREGVGLVETGAGYKLIDKAGAVLASGYEYMDGIVNEGRVPVGRNDKHGYLDLNGNVVIPLEYDFAGSFSRGLAPVKKGEKWGYIDRDGHERVPFIFDEAGPFASGLAPVRSGKESGFIDKSGKFAFHLAFRQAPGFLTGNDEGLFVADSDVSRFWTSDDRFGLVNIAGKVIWGPTKGSPDHPPIMGWSEENKAESCKGIPKAMRAAVAKLPAD